MAETTSHTSYPSPSPQGDGANLIDRAARSADKAIDATRRLAGSAIDGVADKVHGMRDIASPALNRLVSPYDSMLDRTRETPAKALLAAAAAGAVAMALIALLSRARR